MNIALLSGGFPPDFDAIGHYTWWLSGELAAQGHAVTVFTSRGREHTPPPGVKVVPAFDYCQAGTLREFPGHFARVHAECPFDWLVVQYNPFSFGKRGLCPQLPGALRQIHKQTGTRLASMFHETMVPYWPWFFTIMFAWQYPIFRLICHTVETSFVSTERWIPQVRQAHAKLPCHHLPVGSNIATSPLTHDEARARLNISPTECIVGIFGQAHVSRPLSWIAEAIRAIQKRQPAARVLYVGPDGEATRQACTGVEIIDAGLQPQEVLGDYLRAMDLLLSPFTDGASTRRGSMMAALQHGIPVATTYRQWTDKILMNSGLTSLLLSSADNAEDFAKDVAPWQAQLPVNNASVHEQISTFYQKHFSWETIAKDMVRILKTTPR